MRQAVNPANQKQRPTAASWATIARWQMVQVKRLIERPTLNLDVRRRRLRKAEQLLEHLQAKHGSSYNTKRAYLWEELAAAWFRLGNITHVDYCLRRMASLQPGCADAYLSLGYYLSKIGLKEGRNKRIRKD